eukprot:XP_001697931.1 predicted protein [Chlamydomonas reinhardtii]
MCEAFWGIARHGSWCACLTGIRPATRAATATAAAAAAAVLAAFNCYTAWRRHQVRIVVAYYIAWRRTSFVRARARACVQVCADGGCE